MEISEIGKWIAAARDVLVGLSAASAAIFAYLGLSAWRKELKGKAEYELAKEVLKSVYRVREAFKYVRKPTIYCYEYPADMKNDYERTKHVYEKRFEKIDDAFRELEEHHLAAQVEWGSEFQNVIEKLRSCKADLLVAVQQRLERNKNPQESSQTTTEERSVLDSLGSKMYDTFTPKINEAIADFEGWLRPHIRNKG